MKIQAAFSGSPPAPARREVPADPVDTFVPFLAAAAGAAVCSYAGLNPAGLPLLAVAGASLVTGSLLGSDIESRVRHGHESGVGKVLGGVGAFMITLAAAATTAPSPLVAVCFGVLGAASGALTAMSLLQRE